MAAVRKRTSMLVLAVLMVAAFGVDADAATLVVNGVADASPPATGDGVCSLREAMQAILNVANFGDCVNSGGAYGTSDTIHFAIAGTGVHTIHAVASLPTITKPMLIDGYSQPGASANTLAVGSDAQLEIEINGGLITDNSPLFQLLGSGGSVIKGLVIDNFGGHIIEIGFSVPSSNNKIAGNFLGVDPTGTSFVNGTNSVINLQGAANTIGGTTPADRNVIAGHGGVNAGTIYVFGPGNNDNVIAGNYIGVNAAGMAALPAGGSIDAIEVIASSGNTIGGGAPGAGNVIVASNVAVLIDSSANNSVIQGNLIGTDATGTVGLAGAGATGIQIADTSSGTTIGGSAAGEGNVVSGGRIGIDLRSGTIQTPVKGNKVGTDVTGTLPLGNSQCGISVAPGGVGSAGIHIGGSGAGEGNVVAFNGTQGVQIADGTGTLVQRNSIFANGGLGISFSSRCDLIATPTPNDPGDTDTGANNLENHPVITSATLAGSLATVAGTLDVGTPDVVNIEVFANASCDPSGFGEGQTYVGSTQFITGGAGTWSLSNLTVPPGTTAMTATLTSGGNNTSEFSNCFAFPLPPAVVGRSSRKAHAGMPFDLPLIP